MTTSASDLEAHRPAITGHCYRMLGSSIDADDAVQETMVRAWRGLEGFDGRASVRTWLHRIATNVCLDALASRKRRGRPVDEGPVGTVEDELVARDRTHWLEPVAEARVVAPGADPAERLATRQSVRLAFVAALQWLPPKQRAALLLTEVLDWSAAEVAEALETTVPAVNSALQRARATLAERGQATWRAPVTLTPSQEDLLARYVDAFHRYDAAELASLLREDVVFSMPPFDLWLRGPVAVQAWLEGRGAGCRGSRLVPVEANGQPAFAQYKAKPGGGYVAWALAVLELDPEADRIAAWTSFLDVETQFPRFGLALELPAD